MNEEKNDFDKNLLMFVLGGAALGAFAGYMVKKIGLKNIATLLKAKDLIPPNIADTIKDFASKKLGE